MGAGRFVEEAELESTGKHGGMCRTHRAGRKSIASWNTCSCHPIQWGLKKGRRRGRRRYAKIVIKDGLRDAETREENL